MDDRQRARPGLTLITTSAPAAAVPGGSAVLTAQARRAAQFTPPRVPTFPAQVRPARTCPVDHEASAAPVVATSPASDRSAPMAQDSVPEGLQMPPIPLVSGTQMTTEGASTPVQSVEVVVTGTDGTQRRIALQQRHGGWWAP